MKKFLKFILLISVIIFNSSFFTFAELEGPKVYRDPVTEGPLLKYQERVHRPDIGTNMWYKSKDGKWYFLDGASYATLGWHHDTADGLWYYFDLDTGEMVTGWRKIGGLDYYFSEQIYSPNWYYSNNLGTYIAFKVGVKSLGSMYQNEYTPDGSFVNEEGVKVF